MRGVIALGLVLAAGCAPSAPPAAARAPSLRIQFHEPAVAPSDDETPIAAEHREAAANVRRAIVRDLARAGFTIVDRGRHDLTMEIAVSVQTRTHEATRVREVTIALSDREGTLVDRVRYDAADRPTPAERVAASIATAVAGSNNVARFSEEHLGPRAAKRVAHDR